MAPPAQAEDASFTHAAVKFLTTRQTDSTASEQQASIRRHMRERRRALSNRQRRDAACRAANSLLRSPSFRRSQRIALYFAMDGELDPAPLLRAALAYGKQCFVPALSPGQRGRMWFAPLTATSRLRRNRFGIPEPVHRRRDRLTPRRLDLVLVPLAAFDARGHRIGMGGGYYDRAFAFRRVRHRWRRPLLIGYAYEFQRVANIAAQPWDINVDAIVTEGGHYWAVKAE